MQPNWRLQRTAAVPPPLKPTLERQTDKEGYSPYVSLELIDLWSSGSGRPKTADPLDSASLYNQHRDVVKVRR